MKKQFYLTTEGVAELKDELQDLVARQVSRG